MTSDADLIRMEKALTKAGDRRTKGRLQAAEAGKEAEPLIIALYQAGYTKTDLADMSGFHVRAIHDILRKAGIGPRRRRLTQE